MKHISIKKTTKDGDTTILIENYLSDYGCELWRMCYRHNFSSPNTGRKNTEYYTYKDSLLRKPDARQIARFFAHFEIN